MMINTHQFETIKQELVMTHGFQLDWKQPHVARFNHSDGREIILDLFSGDISINLIVRAWTLERFKEIGGVFSSVVHDPAVRPFWEIIKAAEERGALRYISYNEDGYGRSEFQVAGVRVDVVFGMVGKPRSKVDSKNNGYYPDWFYVQNETDELAPVGIDTQRIAHAAARTKQERKAKRREALETALIVGREMLNVSATKEQVELAMFKVVDYVYLLEQGDLDKVLATARDQLFAE